MLQLEFGVGGLDCTTRSHGCSIKAIFFPEVRHSILAQHTASVECRTMFEVTHAIVCHAMLCRHMISSNPMCYLHVPSLAQVCNFYGTSHCCPVPPQNNFLLLENSSRGGILFRSQWWKLFSTEILVY